MEGDSADDGINNDDGGCSAWRVSVCLCMRELTDKRFGESHMVNETLAPFISRVYDAELN